MACEGKSIIGPLFITKTRGRSCMPGDCIAGFFPVCGAPRTTEIRNFQDITIDLNTPLERIPIPEMCDNGAILIKVFGNHNTINITWTVHLEDTNIVRQTLSGAEVCNAVGGIIGGDTTSPENQMKWWLTVFQSNSITDRYNLYLGDCTVNCLNCGCGTYPPTTAAQEALNFTYSRAYHKEGAIQNVRFSKNQTTPVTYNASLTFYTGDIQENPNECG